MERLGYLLILYILRRKIGTLKSSRLKLDNGPFPPRKDGEYGWFIVEETVDETESCAEYNAGCNVAGDDSGSKSKLLSHIYYYWISKYFTQVFRVARKAELVPSSTELTHLCFGTVNGKDGKPFKTRDGGVMQLSELLDSVTEYAYQKMKISNVTDEHKRRENAEKIGIAAIKFGDLINHYSKDCVFDIDKFMASEGKTGVYLLYVIARINSILKKIPSSDLIEKKINGIYSDSERDLVMVLVLSGNAFVSAYNEKAPNIVCENAYKIAVAFSKFYQENHIINEDDVDKKQSWLTLCKITKQVLEKHLNVLGIESVDRM